MWIYRTLKAGFSTCQVTYDWERDNAIRQEIVIQSWQIRSSTIEKLQCCLDIQAERIGALNGAQCLFRLFLQDFGLRGEVLNNGQAVAEGCQGSNVVERSVFGEECWVRIGQECLVD